MAEADHAALARAVYDASADRYVELVGTELSPATEGPIDRALLNAFTELVSAESEARVADVGCGPGRVAGFLSARGFDAIGVDVSTAMLVEARRAHPGIEFEEGGLVDLPLAAESLVGAVCWYSIIHTPPDRLAEVFAELRRVLMPDGYLLLGFQAGDGEAVHRADAHDTGLPLTSYRHGLGNVADQLADVRFEVHATAQRAPEFDHESTPQAFVIARRR